MTQPAKRTHLDKVNKTLTQQSWLLFVLVIAIVCIDTLWLHSNFVWSKNFASGAVLNFIGQYVMTKLAFRYTGYHARKRSLNQLYLAEASRWTVTIVGFMIIIYFVKPLLALAVILGYLIAQFGNILLLWKLR